MTVTLGESYERLKKRLLEDEGICIENRELFAEFFRFQEYKLKRMRGNSSLDENSHKTVIAYVSRLRTVNNWFGNKSWRSLTKEDIQRVYDDLEDGKITTQSGKPIRDKRSYYNLIIRSKPFEMAGKKQLVKQVIQFAPRQSKEDVRFISEEDFRRLIEAVQKPEHRLFLWLCWDIGENARSILRLQKRDCVRQTNEHLSEPEYLINLRREILKRSRRARSEVTNYRETATYLDLHLKPLSDDSYLFDFGDGAARKVFLKAAQRVGVRCKPGGHRVTLKDLRSSMACDLLSKGWSRDEVNARLGHAPSSDEINRYVNYLALDRVRPKKKFQENQTSKLTMELAQIRDREKLTAYRLDRLQQSSSAQIAYLKKLADIQSQIAALQIAYIQGRLNEQGFASALAKQYNALVIHSQTRPEIVNESHNFFDRAP